MTKENPEADLFPLPQPTIRLELTRCDLLSFDLCILPPRLA